MSTIKMPGFNAEATLYRSGNRYRSSGAEFGAQSVVAAYIPGPETQNKCSGCTRACDIVNDACLAEVAASVSEACWGSLGWGCAGALAWGAWERAACRVNYEECIGLCNIPDTDICCPKFCGLDLDNPIKGNGAGCCDHGESCIPIGGSKANTRDGCCPSGRRCGIDCCAAGEICCGGQTCCPSDQFCSDDGACLEFPVPSGVPFGNPPPPKAPGTPQDPRIYSGNSKYCGAGRTPCGNKCCPPELQCCDTDAGPACMTSCGPR